MVDKDIHLRCCPAHLLGMCNWDISLSLSGAHCDCSYLIPSALQKMWKDVTFSCQIVSESNEDIFGTQLIHFGHNYVQAPMKYVKPSISHPSLIPVCTCLRFQYGQTCQRTPCVGLACHRPVVVQASNCERDMISHMTSYMTLRII